jgi:hypothetical protein
VSEAELLPETRTPESSSQEDKGRENISAEGLFYAACEAANRVFHGELHYKETHKEKLLLALQSTMELVEFGKEHPIEIDALLQHHKVKERAGLDVVGMLVKLIFPHAKPSSKNCYANAIRHTQRQGQSADQLPPFLRETGIEQAATEEVKLTRGAGQAAKPTPIIVAITCPLDLPEDVKIPTDGLPVKLIQREEKPFLVIQKPKSRPRATA